MAAKKNRPAGGLVAVIMAGGAGTRFWPLSTPALPKQFLTAFEDRSLYRQAVERARALAGPERTLVITGERFAGIVREQSPEIPRRNVILEPMRRDTAPAILIAAAAAEARWPGCVQAVMPSDHRIDGASGFRATIRAAAALARRGKLVTIGIPPEYPATAYGYLHLGARFRRGAPRRLRRFVEKPDRRRAGRFVASGEYLWNSGIFVWKAAAILEEARRSLPEHHRALAPLGELAGSPRFARRLRRAFERIASVSIDFGVMEKAAEVWAVPARFGWSDVGGWAAARDLVPADRRGNRARGPVIIDRSRGNLAISSGGDRPLICLGIDGLVVVATPEGTLVCRADLAESIKPLVEKALKMGSRRG